MKNGFWPTFVYCGIGRSLQRIGSSSREVYSSWLWDLQGVFQEELESVQKQKLETTVMKLRL